MPEKLKVFLCHASENKPIVKGLYDDLVAAGYEPWLDSEVLVPGMDWDLEIKKGMRASDAVIVCLSTISVSKEGYIQKELKFAQDHQDEKPRGTIYLIPLRLDKCDTPYDLQDIQWADYTSADGFEKLVRGLNIRAKQLGKKEGTAKKKTVIPEDELPPVGDLPIGSRIPFSSNPNFEGRLEQLKKLGRALLRNSDAGVVINQAIIGMGGLGKTQLAVEFAYRYGRFFRGVHWLDLADPSLLDSEIAQCGMQMSLPNFPADQPSQVIITVNTWKEDGPRLLVLDNFEAVDQVNKVISRLRHSNLRLLVTSRRTDWTPASGLESLPLELFAPGESFDFLKKALDDRKEPDSEADLNALAERLGHLPLALELASRYLNGHPRLKISEYLTQLRSSLDHPSMQDWRNDLHAPTEHDLHLLNTFAISWNAVKNEAAQKVFLTAGYLAPNSPIPLEILERSCEIDSTTCDEALGILIGLGLLRKSDTDLPFIHPLLAEYGRGLAKDNQTNLKKLSNVLGTISSDANETGLPVKFLPLRSHLPVTATHTEDAGLGEAGTLWNNYGYNLWTIADFSGAKVAFERAIKIDEASYGPEHPSIAIEVNNLGLVLQSLGDLAGARASFERAIKIGEANYGPDHPSFAIRFNNLGTLLQDLGDLAGAKATIERAINIWKANIGEDHPQVASGVNNLGLVLKDLGDLAGAKTAFERAIHIWEANLGRDHPQVASGVNNLGLVLQASGDLVGAKAAYVRAIKIWEVNLGEDHPQVAIGVNNLGWVLHALGDLQGALGAYERALKIDEATYGPDHTNIAIRFNNVGAVLKDLGDLVGAKVAYERALTILRKFLPPDHPNIKIVQGNLDSLE